MENILEKVENYIHNYYKENSRPELLYHDYIHTSEVVNSAKKLGEGSNISNEELEILLIAAYFHDTGYTIVCEDHESVSVSIMRDFFKGTEYPQNKIDKIRSCIMSTKIPQSPSNIVEKLLCDADLLHFGKKNFFERNDLLRLELEKTDKRTITEVEWINTSLEFINKHEFFSEFARDNYNQRKMKNLLKLQKQLRKSQLISDKDKLKEEKIEIEKAKLQEKRESLQKGSRGIETMFRNVMRTHVEFSSMADSKANIMISVNTLILTAVIAVLARKLDSNPHLIIPTVIITLVSLTTLIFATLVTRPKITNGTFTEEDIKSKNANLLFFGNFYKMKLKDFTWGMKEMINDREFLYGSMIKDFYYLGQVLGKKYKYLNICYSIFLIGIIISVIAFGIAVFMYPEVTDLGTIIE